MEPESDNGLDTFLRRVAQAATIGAAVGAAVAAGRAATRRNGAVADEPQDVEKPEQAEARDREDEPQAREQDPSADEEEDLEQRPEPQAQEKEPNQEPEGQMRQEEPMPRAEAEEAEEELGEGSHGQSNGEAASLVGRALRQVQQLTGREAEGVLGLRRDNGNWVVSVEVVELHRVPSSTDVLATYDVVVDENGELREYNRTGRYVRGRAGEQ